MGRKWLPTFAELVDRMSIHQLKEIFLSENKDKYAKEMKDIAHDLDIAIQENNTELTGKLIRAIVVLSQMNAHIWHNEYTARKGDSYPAELLKKSRGLNGMRSEIMNIILHYINKDDRKDHKVDCLAADHEWSISLDHEA